MARMTGFVFQDEYLEKLAKLSDQEVGRLVRALAVYHAKGEEQELAGRESIAYDFIKVEIDRIDQKYEAKCETNRNNRERSITTVNDRERPTTNEDKVKVKVKDKENNNSIRRFTPPTRDEVAAYIAEKGYLVDADRWLAYYESNGWKVGKNPMKDWKAAVRTWTTNGYDQPVKQTKQPIAQRDYTQREYEDRKVGELPSWLVEEIEAEDREKKAYFAAHGLEDTAENRKRLTRIKGEWVYT